MNANKKLTSLDKKVLALIAVLMLLTAAALAAAFLLPPNIPTPVMPEGETRIYVDEYGSLSVYWPELPEGCSGCLRLKEEGDSRFALVSGKADASHAAFPGKKYDSPVQLRLSAAAEGKNLLGMSRKLESENYLEIALDSPNSIVSQVQQPVDLKAQPQEDGSMELSWNGPDSGHYEIYCMDEDTSQPVPVKSVEGTSAVLRFGADGDLAIPAGGQPVQIAVRWLEQREGYILYGPLSEPASLVRETLVSGTLAVDCTETGERIYTLSWSETKGDYYEVQTWNEEYRRWDTVWQVDAGGQLSYETDRLASGSDCLYQVVAYEQASAAAIPKITAGPEKISFRASFSPLYATVWPLLDQPLYQEAEQSEILATVPGGTALCVLEEKNGFFYVRFHNLYGYVDSRFCMIDLTEYTGDLCEYNITNSYHSVFKIHEYPIEQVTGQVIQGFENVKQADGGYLVPFLYPSAQKLIKAAEAAEKDGYKLKIYEAYRPNAATRFLYDTTFAQLDNPIPGQDGTAEQDGSALPASAARMMPEPAADGNSEETVPPPDIAAGEEGGSAESVEPGAPAEPVTPEESATPEAPAASEEPVTPESPDAPVEPLTPESPDAPMEPLTPDAPDAPAEPLTPDAPDTPAEPVTPETPAAPAEPAAPAAPETPPEPVKPEPKPKPEPVTLGKIMTDGRFRISAFLAASVSNHNRGIALDLTLETRKDGRELEMQSAIHDLSWYAAVSRNNDNARLLEKYMKDIGGMTGLTSEWWHFQDDGIKEELNLTGYLSGGVSAEGWKKDDTGWRYQKPDGSVYRNAALAVDGQIYKLNKDGYVTESE